jgi:(p)ppGpp synthase/HD superfamily hydrolase
VIYSTLTRRALDFAEAAHRGQLRKGTTDIPFMHHPVALAALLIADGADEELVCAAYLHDVVEHTPVTLATVARLFGAHVARLVDGATEPDLDERGRRLPWHDRRSTALLRLERAEPDVVALKAADVCANIADLVVDHYREGGAVWARFPADAHDQVWFYRCLGRLAVARLEGRPRLHAELGTRLDELGELPLPAVRKARSRRRRTKVVAASS